MDFYNEIRSNYQAARHRIGTLEQTILAANHGNPRSLTVLELGELAAKWLADDSHLQDLEE